MSRITTQRSWTAQVSEMRRSPNNAFHSRVAADSTLQLYNLEGDLHISDTQYLICLSIFFIPYALLDVGQSA